ncbi:Fic family protein [Acidisoma sp. C75]
MAPRFTTPRIFKERIVPEGASLAGYAALVHALGVDVPLRSIACVSLAAVREGRRALDGLVLFDHRYRPQDEIGAHLVFALRHEEPDLRALKRIFDTVPEADIALLVRQSPTGAWARRVWFFFEWLTGRRLDLPDATAGNYVEALSPDTCFVVASVNSPRHRVRDNLPGVPGFCPVIRRTQALASFAAVGLAERAAAIAQGADRRVLARAASFLLLADSQASFRIEGETPPRNRVERWGRAVMQAGQRPLSVPELERLQSVLVEDARHIRPGLRTEGVFLGDRDPDGMPVPELIGARPTDLAALMDGMIAANARMTSGGLDPVLQAAAIAYGFVTAHPFEDGNGRLHRFLIHHVLAERGFSPPGILFPVSTAILAEIDTYASLLRERSAPLMDHIDWRPTAAGNVEVLNDTRDLYALFDVTDFAEFLYACVARTVEQDLPREIGEIEAYDRARQGLAALFEMADQRISLLIRFIRQNGGRLSKARREKDFASLRDDEVEAAERIVAEAYRAPNAEG